MSEYSAEERKILLELARSAIEYALKSGSEMVVNSNDYPSHLKENAACFVTLMLHGMLRGCIGSLQAYRPLVEDVAGNAYAAAFADPRFAPVTMEEFAELEVHISVLTMPEFMTVESQADLLQQLQPGVDGLILEDGLYRATFLPAVWETLPVPERFLAQLKLKAGLPPDYWSSTIQFKRYKAKLIK